MNIPNLPKRTVFAIVVTLILLIGLITSLILIKNPQIFKSRADEYEAIQVIGADCHGSECNAESKRVRIKIDRQKLEELAE